MRQPQEGHLQLQASGSGVGESFSTTDARAGEVVSAGRYEVLPELANLTVENVTEACAGARQGDRLARRRWGYRSRRRLAGRG